jgi:hypothetical protein
LAQTFFSSSSLWVCRGRLIHFISAVWFDNYQAATYTISANQDEEAAFTAISVVQTLQKRKGDEFFDEQRELAPFMDALRAQATLS